MPLLQGQVLRSDYINQIIRALQEATSVINGLEVQPTSPASMNVIVRAGTAVISGTVVSLAGDTQVAISTPDATYPRFDLITLKSNGTIGYYTGTPETAVAVDTAKPETYVKPKPPATPAGEVALAEVFVPAGATAIDKIIDRRVITNLNASQMTGGVLALDRIPTIPYTKTDFANQSLKTTDTPYFYGLKVKDVDPTPVTDVLLKVIDGTLQVRNIGDTAYQTIDLNSIPPIPYTKTDFADQALKTTSNVRFATVSVGDLCFKNGWRITEDDKYGLVLISPSGRKFKLMLEVVE